MDEEQVELGRRIRRNPLKRWFFEAVAESRLYRWIGRNHGAVGQAEMADIFGECPVDEDTERAELGRRVARNRFLYWLLETRAFRWLYARRTALLYASLFDALDEPPTGAGDTTSTR